MYLCMYQSLPNSIKFEPKQFQVVVVREFYNAPIIIGDGSTDAGVYNFSTHINIVLLLADAVLQGGRLCSKTRNSF